MLARHGFLCLTVKNSDNAQRKKNLFTQLKNTYLNQKFFSTMPGPSVPYCFHAY